MKNSISGDMSLFWPRFYDNSSKEDSDDNEWFP